MAQAALAVAFCLSVTFAYAQPRGGGDKRGGGGGGGRAREEPKAVAKREGDLNIKARARAAQDRAVVRLPAERGPYARTGEVSLPECTVARNRPRAPPIVRGRKLLAPTAQRPRIAKVRRGPVSRVPRPARPLRIARGRKRPANKRQQRAWRLKTAMHRKHLEHRAPPLAQPFPTATNQTLPGPKALLPEPPP